MELAGKKVAVLAEDYYENLELWYPVLRLREAGAQVTIVGPKAGETYKSKEGYPAKADVAAADEFGRKNAMLLRNTSMINFFDLCAISLPLPRDGGLATGLMLVGRNGSDAKLFSIAAAVERLLAS